MPFSHRHLKSFVNVASIGSVSGSAAAMHISQPALTQTIRNLEDMVGTSLFDRSAKGVTLTRAGEEFFPVAKRLISEMENALEDLRGLSEIRRGRVTVAALPSIACEMLPRIVAKFVDRFPNLEAIIYDGLTSSVEEMVQRGQCDFGISCPDEKIESLFLEKITNDVFELMCHHRHPLANVERVTWDMICDHKFISLSPKSSTRTLVDQAFASVGRIVDPSFEVGHITTAGGIVASGLGVTVIPRMTRVLINRPNLVFRKIEAPVFDRQVSLFRQKTKSLSPAAQILWDMIKQEHVSA
jgi:LysR family carnitine catabolism transcriptional activator